MCVCRMKPFLAVILFAMVLGGVLSAQATTSVIDPATIAEVNPSGYGTALGWDDARTTADLYWLDRTELIGVQGNITDVVTGKSMIGMEGIILNNGAKGTKGNGPGDDYELKFKIRSGLPFKGRVYVMIGLRDVFSAEPTAAVRAAFDDNAYSPQTNITRIQTARTWIGFDANGDPVGTVFNNVLRRPGGMPMVFNCRDGVGEEYFAFYHDYDPGADVGIYGCYSSGSNYYVFAEPVPAAGQPPAMWTSADIGNTKAGSTHYDWPASEWVISANGADVWGNADAFRYVYTQNSGDFVVQARVNYVHYFDWGKAGLMVRQSTDPGSPHAFFALRANSDYYGLQGRPTQGGGSIEAVTWWTSNVIPTWIRLARTGNTFTMYYSGDAVNWSSIGSADLAMSDPVLVGMATTSHTDGVLTTASYSKTYVSGKGLVFVLPGFDQSVDQGAADSTFTLDGTGSLDADTYLWEQVPTGAPMFTIADPTQATLTLDAKDVDIFGDTNFVFRLTVTNSATGASQSATTQVFMIDKEQADAGPDQEVGEGIQVTLDGSGSTGVITSWLWQQIGGPDVAPIQKVTHPDPYFFTGNYVDDQVLQFKLTINGGEQVDFVEVTVRDAEKTLANAGPDQVGYEMRTFQGDATASNTRDGVGYAALSYVWQQIGGPAVYKVTGADTATPTFIAPEIPLTAWPPTRTLSFRVTVTGPNGSVAEDTVNVTIKDAEFETVFYREHEDFDFHGSPVGGKWYPTGAEFDVHYASGAVANEVYGTVGRLDPNADYWWNGSGGSSAYRPGVSLSDPGGQVRDTCGTDMKSGWINPGAGDFWKYTFELPYGSTRAYVVNWLGTDNSWHGNSRIFYDYEQGNTSPVGVFRICRRGWDNMAPLVSQPFSVNPGLHKITMDAYGGGEPNYSRWELHVPQPDVNIADAGADFGAASGEVVTLSAKASQVVGTTYNWEQVAPDSPAIALADAGGGVATFTAPAVTDPTDILFRLTVAGAANDSVDFVWVTIIPANQVLAIFADQRTARDSSTIDWGNRNAGGAVWGSDYQAGNWGALPPRSRLSSNVVVHHNLFGENQNNDCWSQITFNLPAGSAGDYFFYMRAAYQNGDSAFIRPNEGVMGIWPTGDPANENHLIADDNGYRGQMEWNWAAVNANTVPLLDGQNVIRIYGRESHCNEGRPFTWDAMIFSKAALDRGNLEQMDRIAKGAQIPVALAANSGADFTAYEGKTAVLDGTGTLGAITSWLWEQTAGPAVAINNAAQPVASFTAPGVVGPTTLTFRLTVGDGVSTASDTVNVLVLEEGPAPPPTNLAAESVELGIKLTWNPAPGAVSYTILRRDVGIPWPFDTLVAENVTATQFTDMSMPIYMDTIYSYTLISVNSFGESGTALPAQNYALSANLALRGDTAPFAKKPHPGWTLGTLMNNRAVEESFDSWYNSEASADDWWGYFWATPLYFKEIHYYPGNVFGDGGFWTSLGVQFTKDGVFWYDIPNVTIDPPYDFTDSPNGRSPALGQLPYVRRHVMRFPRVEGIGVRIYGAPGGTADFTSMAELEVYGVPGNEGYLYSFAGADTSGDEGSVVTLDGSNSSTPLAVKYQWEQVTGAGGAVTQVDMSPAFNRDVIWAQGEVLANQYPFEPSGERWVYTSNPDVGPYVLPADGKAGAYQFGPYTGNNCLLLSDQQRSGVIPVTPGNYGSVSFVFAGASGNHWCSLVLNYANGDSAAIPFEFSDWFFRGDLPRVVEETYRVNSTNGSSQRNDSDPVGGPNLYERSFAVDSTRTLVSVTFSGFPGSGTQTGGIFATNLGPPVPLLDLANADSAVCTFTVPQITSDQVVTLRLTVWDALNNSATDDIDVMLIDTGASRADAGPDIEADPFTNVTLDGGASQNASWVRWQQIGGPAPITLWNADQTQATIIAPQGGTMTFKVTIGASNGTVTSDTMVVTVRNPIGVVPSSGYIQDVLMLGQYYESRITGSLDINVDQLAAVGGQANQTPNAGDAVTTGFAQSETPLIWTPQHRDDGYWLGPELDNFIGYFHVYIASPEQRDARAILRHDDEMRCWNNGALSFGRDGWDGGVEVTSDFTLYEGVNSMTFKLHEGGGGNYLQVRFTDRNNNQYSDLKYALNFDDLGLLSPPSQTTPDPPDGLIVGEGELFYLDGRASAAGASYTWEQVYPQDPPCPMWYGDENVAIVGAPFVDTDTDFFFRLWVDTGLGVGADVVKVTVATKQVPGAVSGATGEWAGDVGAVLRWSPAAHASYYIIQRAAAPEGPFSLVGTADTNSYVDVGALALDGTYYYSITPASILNVGTGAAQVMISRNANIGNVALSDLATPIVGQPSPLGGGSRDIGLMKDAVVAGQNYDTYDGNTPNPGSLQGEETFEFFGYLFDTPVETHSLVYYTGGVFGDGGFWTTLGVQVTKDGVTWQDASGFVSGPVYDTTDSPAGRGWNEKYIISIVPDTVVGVRVAGHAGGSARFVSIAELEVYADVGGLSANAGTDGAADELAVVTLDGSATTGATAFLWTQVGGPAVVINNADQQVASFTAPAVVLQETVTFRLTASNAQWSAWDEVSFLVTDVDTYHLFRYTADFDGRSATGALLYAGGAWQTGFAQHDLVQYMRNIAANEAASETAVAGNDYFFQNDTQSQTYRPTLNPFDVRFLQAGEVDPFIGYTTVGDWWNYNFRTSKTILTGFPADGVMSIAAVAATGAGATVVEVLLDETVVTTINFNEANWGNFQWRPGADTFLVTAGAHVIRLHLIQGGWDFCKFRLDLVVPQIEGIMPTDGKIMLKWNDVGRVYMLQEADTPAGPWTDVYGPTTDTSWISEVLGTSVKFYRVRVQ